MINKDCRHFSGGLEENEAQGKIEIMDLDIDEDFEIMDNVFSIDKDEEIPLVLEEVTLCGLESNLVGEELLSIPKLVLVNEEIKMYIVLLLLTVKK